MTAFTLYRDRASGLHRLHPLTVLALVTPCLAGGLLWPSPWAPYVIFLLAIVPLATWGRVLPDLLGAAWKVVLPFAISVFLIQGFLWTGGTPVLYVGPLSLKREGLLFAVQSTGRILAVVSCFLLLSLTMRPDRLMIALQQRGVPGTLTYLILATIQIVPRFQAKAQTVLDAQRARGLETEGGLGRRVRALVPLIVPLVLGSIVDVEERAIALEARAFARPGPKTSLVRLRDTRAQQWARRGLWFVTLAVLLASIVLRARRGSRSRG